MAFEIKKKRINRWLGSWSLFTFFLGVLILDRVISLNRFGFIYTDIDQTILWNGAYDYSRGIFHEPFFYGQAYNFMLESFLAVPLLWLKIPVYMALPIITSFISLLPFVFLALFFKNRKQYFWAYLSLVFPILLPLEYNFLTTISRGFVQAHLFFPFLFLPLFNPQSTRNVTIFYIISALCVISNQSSVIIVLPILLLVYSYHFKSPAFYLKSLLVIPFFICYYLAKHFYEIHPERVVYQMSRIRPDGQTFLTSLKNTNHFENLFPLFSDWGIVYPFLFLFLAGIALVKSMKIEFLFTLSILIALLITLAIPKVQEIYPNAGLFYSPSRFYLYLPFLLILSSYLIFKKLELKTVFVYFLLIVAGITFIIKNSTINKTVDKVMKETEFPVSKNEELISRANKLNQLVLKHEIDLIVHSNMVVWNYIFDSYAFNPLTHSNQNDEIIISVNLNGDRRTWLYPNTTYCKQILLNGFKIDKSLLEGFDYEIINQNHIVIKNSNLNVYELFNKLNLKFGNIP
jgi:hypothetical protein